MKTIFSKKPTKITIFTPFVAVLLTIIAEFIIANALILLAYDVFGDWLLMILLVLAVLFWAAVIAFIMHKKCNKLSDWLISFIAYPIAFIAILHMTVILVLIIGQGDMSQFLGMLWLYVPIMYFPLILIVIVGYTLTAHFVIKALHKKGEG
jgi:hypothetical protein